MSANATCKMLLTVSLACGSVGLAVQMPEYITNDRALRSALKAAITPEDHERIAAYYQYKADDLNSKAAEYEQAAASYRNGPMIKNLTAPNTAARYEAIAQRLRQEAQSVQRLEAAQEKMANGAEEAFK